MKRIVFVFIIGFAMILSKQVSAQEKAKWNEMEAFHDVMSKTFHPSEEGKLEPVKTRSAEMLEKAIAWKDSKAPAGYHMNAIQENLRKLVKGARELNKMVQNKAPDKELKEELSELHDLFHEIIEKCEHN